MAKVAKGKTGRSRIKSGKTKDPQGTEDNPPDNPQDTSQEKAQEDIDREWRCLTCSAAAPRTGEKKIRMIAIENSEVFIVFRIILDKSRMLAG